MECLLVRVETGNNCIQTVLLSLKLLDVSMESVDLQDLGIYVPLLLIDMGLLLIKYISHVTYLLSHVLVLSLNRIVLLSEELLLIGAGLFADLQLLLKLGNLTLQVLVGVNLGLAKFDLTLKMVHLDLGSRKVGHVLRA